MIRVGLVGEAPHDTESIKLLLEKRYPSISFIPLLNNITGDQLEEQKTKHILAKEFESAKLDFVIFIRDLDSHQRDRKQILVRKSYMNAFKGSVKHKCILFLNIYMIEALILADIETFNSIYKTNIVLDKPVSEYEDPKQFLKVQTRYRYKEGRNSFILKDCNINTIIAKCDYFEKFIIRFEKDIKYS